MGNFRMSRDKYIGENPTQTELIIFVFLTAIWLASAFVHYPYRVSFVLIIIMNHMSLVTHFIYAITALAEFSEC